MKKIVIKVNINCQICKTNVLKTVTKLMGIDKVSIDGEKGILTVIGDVDPVLVVKQIKKIGKMAEIISVGPSKPPEKLPDCRPPCNNQCQLVAIGYPSHDDSCSIL